MCARGSGYLARICHKSFSKEAVLKKKKKKKNLGGQRGKRPKINNKKESQPNEYKEPQSQDWCTRMEVTHNWVTTNKTFRTLQLALRLGYPGQ